MATKKEIKLQVAKENREDIIKAIQEILSSKKTRMTLKQAMEAFLSVNVSDPTDYIIFKSTGLQKVEKEAGRMGVKMSTREYYSDRPEIFRQLPSSMR